MNPVQNISALQRLNVVCVFSDSETEQSESEQSEVSESEEHSPQELMMRLHQFQREGHLCDLTLISSDGEEFMAHAGIVAAASSLLRQELQECKRGNYTVETSFSGRELTAFIHYAYTGDTTDPTLSTFEEFYLLHDERDIESHADEIISLLDQFANKGLLCNMVLQRA